MTCLFTVPSCKGPSFAVFCFSKYLLSTENQNHLSNLLFCGIVVWRDLPEDGRLRSQEKRVERN